MFWKLTCLANTAMSSLKESEEQTSPPATPGSLGVHVANSHFSKTSASSGNKGWLQEGGNTAWVTSSTPAPQSPLQKMSRQPAHICRLPAAPPKNPSLLSQQLENKTQRWVYFYFLPRWILSTLFSSYQMVAWFEKKIIRQATTITIGLESGSLCFGSRFEFGACVKAHLGHFAPVVFVASEDFFFFFSNSMWC